MIPSWVGQATAKIKVLGLTNKMVSDKMGVSYTYFSAIMNGKRTPKNAKERVLNAIEELRQCQS